MTRFLLCYATGEGQTAKIAGFIEEVLETDHDVTVCRLPEDPPGTIESFDAIIVGSPIHMGKHDGAVTRFATTNRVVLDAEPSAFFEVCLSAAVTDPVKRADAERYVEEFREATGWDPDRVGVFAGAIRYSTYGFFKKRLMKKIAADATGDTDTSRDYEYTDWDDVEAFAREFAEDVDAHATPVKAR